MKLTRKSTEFCQFFCRQNPPDPSYMYMYMYKAQVRKGPRGEGKRNEEEHQLRPTATKNAISYWMMTKLVSLLDIPALLQLDDAKQQTTQLGRRNVRRVELLVIVHN